MLKWIACLLTGTALVLGPATVQAKGNKPKPTPEDVFKRLDKNNDGQLSLEEFLGRRKGDKAAQAEKVFKLKDANSDGFLSLEEFKTKVRPNKKK